MRGLAVAMMHVNARSTVKNGGHIKYADAFAGALGNSRLVGGAETQLFARPGSVASQDVER